MIQRTITLIILGLALILLSPALITAQAEEPWSFTLLEADARQLVVELTLADFEVDTITHEGITYQRLVMADRWSHWGQPGQPALPQYSTLFGMPHFGTPHIEILTAESRTYHYRVAPQSQPVLLDPATGLIEETFLLDPASYQSATNLPGPLAEAADIGWLRYQPVFQLRLYPFQYHPQQQTLRVYHRLKVRVTFPQQGRSLTAGQATADFESLLKNSLANYEALPRPALAPSHAGHTQPIVAAQGTSQLKVRVAEPGIYQLTYEDLQSVAPDLVAANPRYLHLTHQGTAVPVLFQGQADGTFDPGDRLLFYGEAVDSFYTAHNVYWLTVGSQPGRRMVQRDGTPHSHPTPHDFPQSQHYEVDTLHWQDRPNGEGEDHWFWQKLTGKNRTVNLTVELDHLASTGPAGQIRLLMHGARFGDRQTQLYLNGQALLPTAVTWSDRTEKLFDLAVPQNYFINGPNQLTIENIPPANTPDDKIDLYINWLELTYQDQYIAEDNQLRFTVSTAGNYTFEIRGFTHNDLRLFDVTDPADPIELLNFDIISGGSDYTLRFGDRAAVNQHYVAAASDQWLKPTLELDDPSAWQSPQSANYLIITHQQFYETVQPLADHYVNSGYQVAVIKVEDLYDEFTGGVIDPQAIRSFLNYAYDHWSPQPEYVLFVGDASQDPQDILSDTDQQDLLPTYYVSAPLYGEAANDYWYAKVHGADDYPDMIIGRLPVDEDNQLTTIIDKIITHRQNPPTGEWLRRVLLVADDDTPDFQNDMEALADLLPAHLQPIKHYSGDEETVRRELNQGALLFSYSGHGNIDTWGNWQKEEERIFNNSQINDLLNGYRLPFMTVANCLSGLFSSPCCDSLGEQFLFHEAGGGVGVWAPASYGFPTPNSIIHQDLYRAMFVEGKLSLGAASLSARLQAQASNPDLRIYFETYNYLGDPATALNLPPRLALTGQATPDPATRGEALTYTLTYELTGADLARNLILTNTLPTAAIYLSAMPPPTQVAGQNLVWHLGDTAAGQYQLQIATKVDTLQIVHGQTMLNQAILQEGSQQQVTANIETTVHDPAATGPTLNLVTPVLLGQPTFFTSTFTGPGYHYTWDFGDDSPLLTGQISTISHTYPYSGAYTVVLTITDETAKQWVSSNTVTILAAPTANFVSNTPHHVGQTTHLTSTSTSGGDSSGLIHHWDFGDGSTDVGRTVTHHYINVGRYSVTLTVTNQVAQNVITQTVVISDIPIEGLSLQAESPITVGQTTTFSATVISGTNVNYWWNLGDGTDPVTGTGVIKHSYTSTGRYLVQLTATNGSSLLTRTVTVTVTDSPPRADFVTSAPDLLNQMTGFTSTSQGSQLAYQWDLGDGRGIGSTPVMSYVYEAAGLYTVVLTVSNQSGQSVISYPIEIVQLVTSPVADFQVDHPTYVGESTTFINRSQDGGDVTANLTYRWDFGDGHLNSTFNATHTYTAVGPYIASLTITNSQGVDRMTQTVIITDVPVTQVEISHDQPVVINQPVTLSANVGSGTNLSFVWDFGDGQLESGVTVTHRYTQAGHYTVSLTVTNSVGSEVTTKTLFVQDEAITGLSIASSSPTVLGQPTWFTPTIAGGTNIAYHWNFGDGQLSTEPAPSHTYGLTGTYRVFLTATNSRGSQLGQTVVTVIDEPIEGLTIQVNNPTTHGQPTYFTATHTTGSGVIYQWDVGDGTVGFGSSWHHTYPQPGSYIIQLTASNSSGSQTITHSITILPKRLNTFLPILLRTRLPEGE